MKIKRSYKKALVAVVLMGVILSVTVYAWFCMKKQVQATPVEIGLPPEIVVLNNETTELDVLNLDGMEVGTTYRMVFCASSSAENVVKDFRLQLAYTENLGEKIELYNASYLKTVSKAEYTDDSVPDNQICMQSRDGEKYFFYEIGGHVTPDSVHTGEQYYDQPDDEVQACNIGIYKTYTGAFENGLWEKPYNMADTKHYLFYMLEIKWDEPITVNIESKETDIIYVSVIGITDELV